MPLLSLALAWAAPASARVGINSGGCAYDTIQEAIDAAATNDTLYIEVTDTYEENLFIDKGLNLRAAVGGGTCNTAVAPGTQKAVLKPDPLSPESVIQIDIFGAADVRLYDLSLRDGAGSVAGGGGQGGFGGGIYNHGAYLTLYDSVVAGNGATYGGGIYLSFGTLTLVRSKVNNNDAGYGGGIYADDSVVTVGVGSVIGEVSNSALLGGAVALHGAELIVDGVIRNSVADVDLPAPTAGGGCVSALADPATGERSSVTVRGSGEIRECDAVADGGAIMLWDSDLWVGDTARVVDSDGSGPASDGGLIWAGGSSVVEVLGSAILADGHAQNGGLVHLSGSSTLDVSGDAVLKAGQAAGEGGLLWLGSTGSSTMRGQAELSNGVAGLDGGLIYLGTGSLDVRDDSHLTGGRAIDGAGIFAAAGSSVLVREQAVIDDNIASGNGGGVYLQQATYEQVGSLVELNSSFIGTIAFPNRALHGAGIYADNSDLSLGDVGGWVPVVGADEAAEGVRVEGNIATVAGGGVALYASTLEGYGMVVSSNRAFGSAVLQEGEGGGLALYDGSTVIVTNSILYNNRARERGGGAYVNDGQLDMVTDGTALFGEEACAGVDRIEDRYCSEVRGNLAFRPSSAADGLGGGIYLEAAGTADLTGVSLWGNGANASAPHLYVDGGDAVLHNVLMAEANETYAATDGARFLNGGKLAGTHVTMGGHGTTLDYAGGSSLGSLNNSVVWPDGHPGLGVVLGGNTLFGACNVGQGVGLLFGGSNLGGVDPLFVTIADLGYYHIAGFSPAFDHCGSPAVDDLDLLPRPWGDTNDAGAFEYQGPPSP